MPEAIPPDPSRRPSLTDVEGILVGHCTLPGGRTGCTVVTSPQALAGGVDVRGGAPGTRETDLLLPECTVSGINAVFLSGGSAFGLEAGTGVARRLEEAGLGYPAGGSVVPIVCGAVLFDLDPRGPGERPNAGAGYEAARTASALPVEEGSVGAGAGCTVGKLFGRDRAMKGGVGSWAWCRSDGLRVGALAAVNCVGDVWDPTRMAIVAGARKSEGDGFMDAIAQLRRGCRPEFPLGGNTVVAVVATNAKLGKAGCKRVAQMAHDALGRCIYPAHTPADGDVVFALATGQHSLEGNPANLVVIGAMAADVLATAIVRGCQAAGR